MLSVMPQDKSKLKKPRVRSYSLTAIDIKPKFTLGLSKEEMVRLEAMGKLAEAIPSESKDKNKSTVDYNQKWAFKISNRKVEEEKEKPKEIPKADKDDDCCCQCWPTKKRNPM